MAILNWILAALGGATAIFLVIVAAAAVLFKDALTAWLTKRVAKGLERDAERYKHELARDMEGYKDELNRIQSIERLKGELRKSVAEKLFEKRFQVLQDLSVHSATLPSWMGASLMMPLHGRSHLNELTERVRAMTASVDAAILHLTPECGRVFRAAMSELSTIGNAWSERDPLPIEDPRIQALIACGRTLDQTLTEALAKLPRQLADMLVEQPHT